MTSFLTTEQVIDLHDAEKRCALLDHNKLESAVAQPRQTFDGRLLHPTLIEQAAALLFHICQAHAFEDANKRTAWLACVTFLDINGQSLGEVSDAQVVRLMLRVATGRMNTADVTLWLLERV